MATTMMMRLPAANVFVHGPVARPGGSASRCAPQRPTIVRAEVRASLDRGRMHSAHVCESAISAWAAHCRDVALQLRRVANSLCCLRFNPVCEWPNDVARP